jgi:maltose alpha-D-glucosyltransferase/alpha-amylase
MTLDPARVAEAIDGAHLERARWYAGKGRAIGRTRLVDALAVPSLRDGFLLLVEIQYADGDADTYAMPAWVSGAGRIWEPTPGEGFWIALVEAVQAGGVLQGIHGRFELRPSAALAELSRGVHGERALGVDQSNTTVVLGERLALKLYRRLEPGLHPEIELGEVLTERIGFPHVPRHAGSITYAAAGQPMAIAILQEFIPDAEDGWEGIIGRLGRSITAPPGTVDLERTTDEVAEAARVCARLHVALARELGTRRATPDDQARWRRDAERQLDRALSLVEGEAGEELRALAPRIRDGFAAFEHVDPPLLARTHGDLHYAQLLRGRGGTYVVDFEGEPTRTIDERRRLSSTLRDVACMVRSLDHIARTAELRAHSVRGSGLDVDAWIARATARFCEVYAAELQTADCGLAFDPALLRAFELEKETYEFIYASQFLPSWLYAPRLGMRWLFRAG